MGLGESLEKAMILLDFSPQYETEALLRGGDESQAREAMHRLGEYVGPNQRFRIPYLRSLARLSEWEGQREQAIGHLREATRPAAYIWVPGEPGRIQAALARMYHATGNPANAHTAV